MADEPGLAAERGLIALRFDAFIGTVRHQAARLGRIVQIYFQDVIAQVPDEIGILNRE